MDDLILHQAVRVDDEQPSHRQVIFFLVTRRKPARPIRPGRCPGGSSARPVRRATSGVAIQRSCDSTESQLTPSSSQFCAANSSNRWESPISSVGQTSEKSRGIEDQDQPAAAIIGQAHPASRRIGKSRAGKVERRAPGCRSTSKWRPRVDEPSRRRVGSSRLT